MIILSFDIEEIEKEIDEKNFKKALAILDEIKSDDEGYELSLLFKISCLINLKRYGECLDVIEILLKENPNEELLWADKVMCHYFSGDKKQALMSLRKLETIVNRKDAYSLYVVSQLANLVNRSNKAIEYADLALEIDADFKLAVNEKAIAASRIKDYDMMNECADKLIGLCDEEEFVLTLPFMLKLFSGNYKGCLDILNNIKNPEDKINEMMKYAIYNQMSEDLNVDIYVTGSVESDLDDALEMLFNYYYDGFEGGNINGVSYVVVKKC